MLKKVEILDCYTDDEDEAISIEIALVQMDEFLLSKWFYLPTEWSEYVINKAKLKKRLRKLQEKLGYNVDV